MQYTTNYNLNIVEGTDIVNPMSVDNPNYTTIDTTMYANECNSIGSATELKTGTVHALTRVKANQNVFRFRATARYVAGDTFTVDGNVVTAQLPDGSALADGAYIIGSDVLCALIGTQLTLFVSINNAEQIMYDQNTSVKQYIDNMVVNSLTSDDTTKALSAKQGKELKKILDGEDYTDTDYGNNKYTLRNKTVSLMIEGRNNVSLAGWGNVQIGQIPAGMRPGYTINYPLALQNADNAQRNCVLTISAGGVISIINQSSANVTISAMLRTIVTYNI